MVTKNPAWKQDSPRQQLAALVSGAQGHLSNIMQGQTIDYRKSAGMADRLLQQAQTILSAFVPDEPWRDSPGKEVSDEQR